MRPVRSVRPAAAVLSVALLGGLAGCGDPADAAEEQASRDRIARAMATPAPEVPAGAVDVTSGRPLAEFTGSASYPFRLALHEREMDVRAGLRAVDAGLGDDSALRDVLSTCVDAAGGMSQSKLIDLAVMRFSGGDVTVSRSQAAELVSVATEYVCPA